MSEGGTVHAVTTKKKESVVPFVLALLWGTVAAAIFGVWLRRWLHLLRAVFSVHAGG